MNANPISQSSVVSGLTNVRIGNNPTDILAYAESLLVADYDEQMKGHATDIKVGIKLKEAYRNQKAKINDLLSKDQDSNHKVKLTVEEATLLNSQPDFNLDPQLANGEPTSYSAATKDLVPIHIKYVHGIPTKSVDPVSVDTIHVELDRLQMRLDGLNTSSEMTQTDLSTITNQRKLAFETMSSTLSKSFEASGDIVRNLK